MAVPALSYEDVRRQRLQDNQKRMQELGLADLAKSLSLDPAAAASSATLSPKPRQIKPRTPKETLSVELRRSSRVANSPVPDYREVDFRSLLGRRSYSSRASSLLNRRYASDEARLEAILQAETIMKELPDKNPTFVKPMLQSHVTGGFWLGLPSNFCKTYLPKKDDTVVLENEKDEEWDTVYLATKTGLSGGWRGFSLDHELKDGDALVFELVGHCRFKVHIVRACEENVKQPEVSSSGGEGRKQQKKSSRGSDSEGTSALADSGKGGGKTTKEINKRKRKSEGTIVEGLTKGKKAGLTSFLQAKKPYSRRLAKKEIAHRGIKVH